MIYVHLLFYFRIILNIPISCFVRIEIDKRWMQSRAIMVYMSGLDSFLITILLMGISITTFYVHAKRAINFLRNKRR